MLEARLTGMDLKLMCRRNAPASRSYRHTYAARIALLVLAILVILLTALSFATYRNVERVVVAREYDSSIRVLATTGATIGEMHALSARIAVSVHMNRDVQWLMEEDGSSDLYEVLTRLDRLDSLRVYNPMILNILVYNGASNTTFDTRKLIHSGSNPIRTDDSLLPRLEPVHQVLRAANSDAYMDDWTRHFAYANYTLRGDRVESGTVTNIDAEWLISAVERMGNADDDYELLLFDSNQHLLYGSEELASAVLPDVQRNITGAEGYTRSSVNGEEHLVVFSALTEPAWSVVLTRPIRDLTAHVSLIRRSILILTLIFATVSVVCALALARVIYRPISNLLSILGPEEGNAVWTDEFDFISHRLKTIREGQEEERETAESYQLFRLLLDSPRVASDTNRASNMPIDVARPIAVCVAKIDDLARETPERTHDRIISSLGRVCSTGSDRATLFAGTNRYVVLANVAGAASRTALAEELVALQRLLWNEYDISLSMSMSDTVSDLRRLTAVYNATASRLRYTFLFGARSFITSESVVELEEVQFTDVRRMDLERSLLRAIRQGDRKDYVRAVEELVVHYSALGIDSLLLALTVLTGRVRETLQEINERRLVPSSIDFDELSDLGRTSVTLDQFKTRLISILDEFVRAESTTSDPRHSVIVAHLLEAIQSSYTDVNLALKSLASDLGMSASYVGHIFKERVGESFADYLKSYRLDRAAALFERGTDLSVRDAMQEVGFDNESYFYRMFKTKFGVTPREYALKTVVVSRRTGREPSSGETDIQYGDG